MALKPLVLAHADERDLTRLDEYEQAGGYRSLRTALGMDRDRLLDELLASGLRGRGGAGFPTGRKASFLPKPGDTPKPIYLTVNADESEPGTFKDREIMLRNPHAVVEGSVITALAIGAELAFIYLRGEYYTEFEVMRHALEEALGAGYVGPDVAGSGRDVTLVIHRGAGAYICGEESALLESLEGFRGMPRPRPPFPVTEGLYRCPTVVNNVQTLCAVGPIIENGAEWFKSVGTEKSTGTKLVSVSGNVRRPGNYEIELGIPAREIVYELAGGPPDGHEVKLWFPGGSSAPVLTGDDLDLPYDFDTMAKAGSMLGSGSIIVIDDSNSVLDIALKVAKFYRHESCGKCTPCREGTNWTVKMLERIERGEATPMDLEIMAGVQERIIGNCLCVLGDSMAMPIGSMIKKFRDEFEDHIERARQEADLAPAPEPTALVGVAGEEAGPYSSTADARAS